MKGNNTILIIVVVLIAAVGAFLLFSMPKRSLAATGGVDGSADAGSDVSTNKLTILGSVGNTTRTPGQSFDSWIAGRKASGWKF